MTFTLYKTPDQNKYTKFFIPKKTGGFREIQAPIDRLALIQTRLAAVLSDCQSEIEHSLGIQERCALSHGFHKKRTIATNAVRHRNKRYVFNTDISGFFPSINFGRVRGFFIKNRFFLLNPDVATMLAQIACHEGRLPQGAPTSPIISDLIVSVLDVHLAKLGARHGCTYTRYADDLTFSTNRRQFPAEIARPLPGFGHAWVVGDGVAGRLFRAGFSINASKTRMQYRDSRQDVTGVIVNKKLGVPKEYYKIVRAKCDLLFKAGGFYDEDPLAQTSLESVRGRLNHIFQIKGVERGHNRISINKGESEKDAKPNYYILYKRFLDFSLFHFNEQMTIICEGETDSVYLKLAIRALHKNYPTLSHINAIAGIEVLPKFFNYTKIADAVQDLGGGTGDISKFIYGYEGALRPFSAPGGRNPVAIIVDNDSGASNVFSAIKAVAKIPTVVDGSLDFYHVIRNLYVVPIPKIGGADTQIEDFFDAAALSMEHGQRKFEGYKAGRGPGPWYPKSTFADLVKKNGKSINFGGFSGILDRIVLAQGDFQAKLK